MKLQYYASINTYPCHELHTGLDNTEILVRYMQIIDTIDILI